MSLFNILVDIAARTASFEAGMTRVEKRLDAFAGVAKRFAGTASGLIGVSIGFDAIRSSVDAAIQRGDEVDRLAERMKTTAENVSQLQFIARQSDIAVQSMLGSIDTFTKNIGMAAQGTGRARRALKELNIEASDLVALPLDQQLDLIADRVAAIENPTKQTTIAMQLFGSADVLSALRNGSDGLRQLREESDRLGYTIDALSAQKLAQADAAIKNLNSSFTGLGNTLAVKVAPFLTTVVNGINAAVGNSELNLTTQLEHLAEERGRLLRNLRFRESEFGRFTLGRRADEAIASTRKEIEAVERAMARVNDQMLEMQRRAEAGSPVTPGVDDKETTVFARQVNYYSALWQELQANYAYLEQLEKRRNERISTTVAARKSLESDLEKGINAGVEETERKGIQTIEAVSEVYDSAIAKTQELSTYAEQAARNMQSYFADFLFDPFKNGMKGMVKGFADTIRQMLSQAAAAKLFETLFGKDGSGKNGSNVSGLLEALIGSFGGGKAAGGPLQQGKWYVAGEHGPEPIWGGGAGAFAAGYGGRGVTVNMPVDMRGASVDAVKLFIAERPRLIQQAADLARAQMRNDRRRGAF